MADCKYSYNCPFFKNLIRYPKERWDRMTKRFCLCSPVECARVKITEKKGANAVPHALAPDNYEEMNQILSSKQSYANVQKKHFFEMD